MFDVFNIIGRFFIMASVLCCRLPQTVSMCQSACLHVTSNFKYTLGRMEGWQLVHFVLVKLIFVFV